MKNVLITGGTGYIGSHLVYELIKNKYTPIVIDNLGNSNLKTLKNITKIFNKKIIFYKSDIKNKKQLEKIFYKHKIYCVVHLAANKDVILSKTQVESVYQNNIFNTISLISIMKKFGVFNIIFASSAANHSIDNKKKNHYSSPYGNTKKICEVFLKDLTNSDTRWKVIILKIFNVIGLNNKNFYETKKNQQQNSLFETILLFLTNKIKYINIYGNKFKTKDGTSVRDFIDVNDISIFSVGLIKNLKKIKEEYIKIYLCNGRGYTVKEIIYNFERIFKIKIFK